jgi:type II secretory pathway pseudopilin PulG
MFKSLVPAIVIASALAAPTFAFAQDNSQLTRAQVKAELVQLEQAGYKPDGDHATYPANIQAVDQRVDAPHGVTATSYGSPSNGSSYSGAHTVAPANDPQSTYFGH